MKQLYFQSKLKPIHLIVLSSMFFFPFFTYTVLCLKYRCLYDGDSAGVDFLIMISNFTTLDYILIAISIFAPMMAFITAIILFTKEKK